MKHVALLAACFLPALAATGCSDDSPAPDDPALFAVPDGPTTSTLMGDALASLDALAQMKDPALYLPSAAQSWLTLSSDYVAADGSTPMTAIVELRTAFLRAMVEHLARAI